MGEWLPFWGRKDRSRSWARKRQVILSCLGIIGWGELLRPALAKFGEVVVVDFNPEVVANLVRDKVNVVYGDVADVEIYDEIGVKNASLVISTVSDVVDNLQLVKELNGNHQRPMLILTAADGTDAQRLYQAGADYVLVPHAVGGEYLAHLLSTHGLDRNFIRSHGQAQRRLMNRIICW